MSHPFTPVIVTASALDSGAVVYLTSAGAWSASIAEAELIEDESHAQLRLLEARRAPGVLGVALAAARAGAHGPEPVHFRERIRASGPSNYPHGKQETPADV